MIFDSYDCADAEGVLLAHTLRIPGGTFKKGRVLSREDLAALREAGIARVSGVRLEAGDVDEDQAALEVARALAGPLVDVGRPVAGRCYLYARRDGLAVVQREVIDAINQCDTGMVIATLSDCAECLQQQAVDGAELVYPNITAANLNEVLDYANETGHILLVNFQIVSSEWFNGLPEDYQTALVEECRTAGQETSEVVATAVEEAKAQLIEAGMTIVDDVDLDAFRAAGRAAYEVLGLIEAYDQVQSEIAQ